jgi:putative sugar O-methyltransferase
MSTSATDKDYYKNIVQKMVDDERAFAIFRNYHPDYNRVLEHATPDFGQRCLDMISPKFKDNKNWMGVAQMNDRVGSPLSYYYDEYGQWSPTTLMYMKVLSELDKWFDIDEKTSVFEIGGGYGGQCRLIKEYYGIKDYYMLDLPIVTRLQDKYLSSLSIDDVQFYVHPEGVPQADLVISSFAFDELSPDWQEMCFRHSIRHSSCGMISGRWIDGGEFVPQNIDLSLINKQVTIEPYKPDTGIYCETIYWK